MEAKNGKGILARALSPENPLRSFARFKLDVA